MFFTCHPTFKKYFAEENGLVSSQCLSFWNAALLVTRIGLMLAMISGKISSTFNERPDVPAIFIAVDICGLLASAYWWCHSFHIHITKATFIYKVLVAVFIVETLIVAISMFFVVSPEGPVALPFFVISIMSTILNGFFVLFVGFHIYYLGRFDCFLSHAWADDESGRKNHYRVLRIAEELQKHGIITWFDERNLELGDLLKNKLARGIQRSNVFIVFLTKAYEDKRTYNNETNITEKLSDSCFFEYNQATILRKQIIAVTMESSMEKTAQWADKLNGNFSFNFNYKGNPAVVPIVPDENGFDENEIALKEACYKLAKSVIEKGRSIYHDIV